MSLYTRLSVSALMLFITEGYSSRLSGTTGAGRGLYGDTLLGLPASNTSNVFRRAEGNDCGPQFGTCQPGSCCSASVS
jgi:hypothetical protein